MTETTVNVGHHPNGNAEAQNLNWIQFNVEYFKTRDGLLKLLELVSMSICLFGATRDTTYSRTPNYFHEYYHQCIKVALKISFSLHFLKLMPNLHETHLHLLVFKVIYFHNQNK